MGKTTRHRLSRLPEAMEAVGSRDDLLDMMVEHILPSGDACRQLVIGPLVWRPAEKGEGRLWYCVSASADSDGFYSDMLAFGDDADFAEGCRQSIIAGIALRGRPIVVHVMEDELDMAKTCELLWPCQKTRQIRAGIQAERARR